MHIQEKFIMQNQKFYFIRKHKSQVGEGLWGSWGAEIFVRDSLGYGAKTEQHPPDPP